MAKAKPSALMGNYNRAEVAFSHGDGAWLVATDGSRYLDCASGIGVTSLGHAHPKLVAALADQAAKLWHVSNLYHIPQQEKLAEMLAARAGLDSVFFCNSGTEATEAAVKIARRAMYDKASNKDAPRQTIVCFEGAFHGRTLAMLAATDRPNYRTGFAPIPQGFAHVPFGNMNVLRQTLLDDAASATPSIAAVMLEGSQGEGGGRTLSHEFLNDLRGLADEAGCFIIADEVQIGMGRSGKLFSYQHSDMTPDIVAVAKGLGGGFPIGAVITRADIAQAMPPGSHGTTFGGNPLAMRVGATVLEVLDEAFLAEVAATSKWFWQAMQTLAKKHPARIRHIQGLGLLLVVVLDEAVAADKVIASLRTKHKVLTVAAAQNSIRFLPPLIIQKTELQLAVDALDSVLAEWQGEK